MEKEAKAPTIDQAIQNYWGLEPTAIVYQTLKSWLTLTIYTGIFCNGGCPAPTLDKNPWISVADRVF